MKFLPFLCIVAPVVVLACGGYFYPAPPTLDHYPERLPGKTMRELLRETNPQPADAATFDQLSTETRAIAAEIATAPREALLKRIDATLERNRAGDYRKRFANCLFDLRDLLASDDVPAAEANAYAAWRAETMDADDGFFAKPPPTESWEFTAAQLAEKRRLWQEKLTSTAERLTAETAKAAPALKPHWLVQAGAWQFKHQRFDEAAALFQRVIDEAPQHPRAEVATLMLARTRIEQWREAKREAESKGNTDDRKLSPLREVAKKALDAYVAAYPQGRFAPDIPGWKGGLARESGWLSEAISQFLRQMDFTDHPEIIRRAVRECEACLDELDVAKIEDDVAYDHASSTLPLEEIAAHPIAALAVVYHFLDSQSREDFDDLLERLESLTEREVTEHRLPPMLRMRRAGREVLPALASAVADRKASYDGTAWQPKYLAILGWAASECGEHRQALRLCELAGPALEQSDDLLFLRAIALQRSGELDAAIAALRKFQEKFPQSPLIVETQFRIATALRDNHEAGKAVVELLRTQTTLQQQPEDETPGAPRAPKAPALHLNAEIDQWIDTLLQFAPLTELERGLATPNLEPTTAEAIRRMLRLRHLAREDFAAARRFQLENPPDVEPQEKEGGPPLELRADAWSNAVTKLERLTRESAATSAPADRAKLLFTLGETWASVRGYLTLPSVEDDRVFGDEFDSSWTNRHRNARVAGLSAAAAADELEQRDELRHSMKYYLQAADLAPGTELAAQALWRANNALRRMAELSPWSAARAFETDASGLSRKSHERLRRECPDSVEARQLSVWWTFPAPAELRWLPGSRQDYSAEGEIEDAFEEKLRGDSDDASESERATEDLSEKLREITTEAESADAATLIAKLETMRRGFAPHYERGNQSRLINDLDDLMLFLHEPGTTPAVRAKYFAARLADEPPSLDDPELQPWRDYLTFLALIRERPIFDDPMTGERRFRPISERMREFLEKFPQSHKREAALARLAIATVREMHGHTGTQDSAWPQAPRLGGYKVMATTRGSQPFDAKRAFDTLAAYEREFPNGRYAAEMTLWRGVASIDAHDWKRAVNLLVATLDGKNRDLHLDAALNLADIFMRLLDEPERRAEIVAALRGNASAQKRLHQFMESKTLGARLRSLDGWLSEQLAEAHR